MKEIQPRNDHLFVKYTDPFQLDTFVALIREVAGICREAGHTKVLVDVSEMPGTMSTMDRFRLGVEGAAAFRKLAQVAIYYQKQKMDKFAETVGVNRGAVVRVFFDLEAARKWLGL